MDPAPRFQLLGRAYFAVQAVAGAVWWLGVFTWPTVREATLGGLDPLLIALCDVPLFVVGSACAALGSRLAVWITAVWISLVAVGMVAYATITTLAGLGAVAMVAATVGSIVAALLTLTGTIPRELVFVGPFAFRVASRSGPARHLVATFVQIMVFWGLFLGIIPAVIVWFEHRWALTVPAPGWLTLGGGVAFALTSALGLWAAISMATVGRGTPLPRATAAHLVVTGPYRFVRNPMALSGIGQGISVGLMHGSWLVVLYAWCGSLLWNWVIRPGEEKDLEERFGDEFRAYAARVRCWVPTLRSRPATGTPPTPKHSRSRQ